MTFAAIRKRLPGIPGEVCAGIELFQVIETHARNFAVAVCRTHHRRVVMYDWNSVGRNPDVELDRLSARGNSLRERLYRVLGSIGSIAPMANHGACIGIEENVHSEKITGRRTGSCAAPLKEGE
jgi:hypothetical protein